MCVPLSVTVAKDSSGIKHIFKLYICEYVCSSICPELQLLTEAVLHLYLEFHTHLKIYLVLLFLIYDIKMISSLLKLPKIPQVLGGSINCCFIEYTIYQIRRSCSCSFACCVNAKF